MALIYVIYELRRFPQQNYGSTIDYMYKHKIHSMLHKEFHGKKRGSDYQLVSGECFVISPHFYEKVRLTDFLWTFDINRLLLGSHKNKQLPR